MSYAIVEIQAKVLSSNLVIMSELMLPGLGEFCSAAWGLIETHVVAVPYAAPVVRSKDDG